MRLKQTCQFQNGLQVLDMVAFLNVILLVIVYYILTSSFTLSPDIDVRLPKAVISGDIEEKNLVVTITGENVIYLREQIVSIKDLKVRLIQFARKNLPVLIKADRRASLGRIVDVWDLCRLVGIEKINIATDSQQ